MDDSAHLPIRVLYTTLSMMGHRPQVQCTPQKQMEVQVQGQWVPATVTYTPGGLAILETTYHGEIDGITETISEVYVLTTDDLRAQTHLAAAQSRNDRA
jgi:hypothetical protein